MTIPRHDTLKEPPEEPRKLVSRTVRGVELAEDATITPEAHTHIESDITPGGAATSDHGHAITLDVFILPTQDAHDAILDDWPHNTAGAANEAAFIWHVPAGWTGFNTVSVVMIPDAEETITADIDVSVAAAGEAYNADTRQSLNETLAIAAGDVDAMTEWPLVDVGSLFGGIQPNDVIAIRFQSDTDTMRILGLHINYGAGSAAGGGPPSGTAGGDLGGSYPNPTVDDGADSTAIHDDTAGEITAITEKTTPVANDEIIIEDSADSDAKKSVKMGNLPAATASAKGIAELATAAEAAAGTDTGRVVTPSLLPVLVQDSKYVYAADAEASDTYAITLTPAPAAYATGQVFLFTANTANTGAATLNVNGLGAKAILKEHDVALSNGDIEAGQAVLVFYDGTQFQMLSLLGNAPGGGGGSGTMTTVKHDDVQVGGADQVTLDFGAGLDAAETPDTEINITVETATTSNPGMAELATVAEANAGTDTGRTVTPDSIGSPIRTIVLTALAGYPTVGTAGCAEPVKIDSGSTDANYWALDFGAASDEYASWGPISMPENYDGGTLTARFYWTSVGAVSTGVAWAIQLLSLDDSDIINTAWGTAVVTTDDAQGVANDLYITAASTAITPSGTASAPELLAIRVFRDVSDANDDMTQDARLIAVKLEYTCEGFSD